MGRRGRDSGLEMTELHGLGDVFIECRRVEDGCSVTVGDGVHEKEPLPMANR